MELFQSWRLALKGEMQLWRVFWIGHFLAYWVFVALFAVSALLLDSNLASLLFAPFVLTYMFLVYFAMWKCAFNSNRKVYGYLARIYAGIALIAYIVGIVTIPIAIST
jgi:hypothetical protein